MAEFKGYLLASGGEPFPLKYMNYESYSTIPNSREEIKAERDDNTRDLTRITAQGHKSSFSFSTRPNLHLAEVEEIMNWLKTHWIELERKINLEYWNNEELTYKTADFYLGDVTWEIVKISGNDIVYKEAKLNFVEY